MRRCNMFIKEVQVGLLLSAVLVNLFVPSGVLAQYYDDYEGTSTSCEHERFYCDYDDPAMFYRCINGVYHTFQCPGGLHFSVKEQTCDWPESADCSTSASAPSSDESEDSSNYDYSGTAHSGGHVHTNSKLELGNSVGDIKFNTWINQPAASKPWWRPDDINPKQWEDTSYIKEAKLTIGRAPQGAKSDPSEPKKKSSSSSKSSKSQPPSQLERQQSSGVQWKSGDCDPSSCQLPHCYCAGTAIPGGLSPSSTPQMVMITFDDEVSAAYYGYFQRLFRPGRYNPNGCPVRGCLYVSGSGTTYDLVYPLYALGVEIASHTISHRFPHTWWASASYQELLEEASGMKENLVSRSGVPRDAIKGFRVPFLQLGGDNMYSALYDSKFVYDTSMFTGAQWEEATNPAWPFTLDYVPPPDYCQHGPCPTKQYPGMWEIPVQRWYGLDGHSCSMPDGCSSTEDAAETFEYMKSNFRRYYNTNRAPFGIFMHARWFSTEHNLEGLDRFIDYLLTLDDVYIVTPSQVIDWMKQPTPMSSIQNFQPWRCDGGATDVWLQADK